MKKNERNAGRKKILTPLERVAISNDYKNGKKVIEIAITYQISIATVYRIIREGDLN